MTDVEGGRGHGAPILGRSFLSEHRLLHPTALLAPTSARSMCLRCSRVPPGLGPILTTGIGGITGTQARA